MTNVDPTLSHESYGTITFSRQHGPPRNVFGSPMEHTEVIRLEINAVSIQRSATQDHLLQDTNIFTGYLTHAQLAEALFYVSSGPPTPITIQYVQGDPAFREEPPRRNPDVLLDQDVESFLEDMTTRLDELVQTTKGPAQRKAQGLRESFRTNIHFIADRMRETNRRTADQAKQEFTAYIARTLTDAGLKVLPDQTPSLPTPPQQS